jgi:hypothetical protein
MPEDYGSEARNVYFKTEIWVDSKFVTLTISDKSQFYYATKLQLTKSDLKRLKYVIDATLKRCNKLIVFNDSDIKRVK